MKLTKIIAAAGLMAASLGASAGADAQRYNGDRDHGRYEHRDNGDRRYGSHDRGHHYGRDHHQRCRTEWRHHHRVRICR